MSKRKVAIFITDILGDHVSVGEKELEHAREGHYKNIPQDILINLLIMVLKDPTEVYRDDRKKERIFNFFYRIEKGPVYVVAVIKVTPEGAFFATIYPTGERPRRIHKTYKRVKL